MNAAIRRTLGILVTAHALVMLPSVVARGQNTVSPSAAQGGGPNACSIIDAVELKRITGLKDILGRGPVLTDPSELPKGRSECEYLGLGFALTSPTTREAFDQMRGRVGKSGKKTEPVSGVGDDAFFWWDPKPGSTRQVGIALRSGGSELVIMDLTTADSIEAMKPRILAVAKSVVPRVR